MSLNSFELFPPGFGQLQEDQSSTTLKTLLVVAGLGGYFMWRYEREKPAHQPDAIDELQREARRRMRRLARR